MLDKLDFTSLLQKVWKY